MAITFISGFEMGTLGEWDSAVGDIAVDTGQKNTGAYSARVNASSSSGSVRSGLTNQRRVSFYFRVASAASGDFPLMRVTAGSWGLYLTTDRYIDLYEGATKRVDGTTQLSVDTWYRISITVNSSDGHAYYWIDGNAEGNYNGTATVVNVDLGNDSSYTYDIYYDDVVWDDTTSSTDDLGDIVVELAQPNAEGSVQDWSDPTGYADVDDAPGSINDSDYVSDDTKDAVTELVGLESCSDAGLSGTDVIDAVKVCARMNLSKASSAGENPQIVLYDNSTEYYSNFTNTYGIEAFTWIFWLMTVMPDDSAAWSQARFDAFQTGMRTYAGAAEILYLSCVMVMIAYHAGAAGEHYDESFSVGLTISETVAYDFDPNRAFSEVLNLAETFARQYLPNRAFSLGVTVTETMLRVFRRFIAFSKSLTVGETFTKQFSPNRAFSKDINLAVTVVRQLLPNRVFSKGIVISETVVANKSFTKTFSKGLTAAETFVKQFSPNRSFSKGITLAEAMVKQFLPNRAFSKGITVAETMVTKGRLNRAFSEGLTVAKTFVYQFLPNRAFSKGLTIAETFTRSVSRLITVSLGITVAETVVAVAKLNRAFTESLTVAETITKQFSPNRVFSKGLTVAEAIVRNIRTTRAFSVGLSIAETVVATFTQVGETVYKIFRLRLDIAAYINLAMSEDKYMPITVDDADYIDVATSDQIYMKQSVNHYKYISQEIQTGGD